MVRELDRVRHESGSTSAELSSQTQQLDFPATAPTANPVFFRTYSRFTATGRETWQQVCTRTLEGLVKLGKLTDAEADIIDRMQRQVKAMPSGRWLWVGGSEWLEQPQNFSGAYNCTSTNVCDWAAFALMMDLAMMGCGTGAILEPDLIGKLPVVKNKLKIAITSEIGGVPIASRQELSTVEIADNKATIRVGDSRQGWVNSYKILLELSSDDRFNGEVNVSIDLSNVRPAGEQLKGFGGMANPVRLPELYGRCAGILNKAIGRQLTSVECCLLIDEAAVTIVAGNIRRCLPAGALVHAESGLVPIEKIRIGDRVLTSKGFYPVTNFFDQGEQSLCRIKTQDSYFECTADHKVAVLTDIYGNYEMVKAKDLQPNDRLVFVSQAIPGTPTELPEFKGELAPHSKRITVPALTPDVAYFIGYLHGDGSVASDGWRVRFRVAEHQQQILEKLISVGESFGLDTHTLTTPEQCKAKAFELQFNSSALNQYLSKFKQPFTSISVPDSILLGTQAIREAYLAGLADADGCYSQGVLVASVHADFLRQIQTIYASLGITTRLCFSVRKRTDKWEGELVTVGEKAFDDTGAIFSQYSLVFTTSSKERPRSFKDHGFPKVMVRPLVNTYRYGWSNHQEQMIVPTLKKFIPEATDLIPVKVESVEMDVRTAHTYDIEVASIHEFVCEGILVSNSAGMRQFNASDTLGATAKDNLWQQDEHGNWRIDPERDALRMSNHTRVFHHKPTLEECVAAVQKQYYSGEGAIQWAGEAVARSNADLLNTSELKAVFLKIYAEGKANEWFVNNHPDLDESEIEHRLSRFGLNPCGEILGTNFHCNLSEIHLNQLDPNNHQEQKDAFTASALSVAALLNHKFQEPRYQYSRELDPIVGVSFTGLFDFFVHAFGSEWLQWWTAGRPATAAGIAYKQKEHEYLNTWREVVEQTVWEYCDRHGIKRPNRCTTVQPSGTKSLLTGASPGWHAPKAQRFIRRITFRKDDPVALACIDYGYSVIPSQSDKDENGNLLDDAYDPRCTEWLIEIPVAVSWADLPGADSIDIGQFSALAQMDFYMGVQQHYVRHNTSATIELREHEVDELGKRIYEAIRDDEGYISAALLARFDDHQTFPRLPFEPIDKATFDEMMVGVIQRRQTAEFHTALSRYDLGNKSEESGPAGCDSDKCLLPDVKPNS
jgi:ribonucleotide reductase, class II